MHKRIMLATELMDALCIYEAVYCIFLCWFMCKAVSSELRKWNTIQAMLLFNLYNLHAWVSCRRQSWCPGSTPCHCRSRRKHGASSSVWPDHPASESWQSKDGRETYDLHMGGNNSPQGITCTSNTFFFFWWNTRSHALISLFVAIDSQQV